MSVKTAFTSFRYKYYRINNIILNFCVLSIFSAFPSLYYRDSEAFEVHEKNTMQNLLWLTSMHNYDSIPSIPYAKGNEGKNVLPIVSESCRLLKDST